MPYDLFVTTTPAPAAGELEPSTTVWHWRGCWPTVWVATVQSVLEGSVTPELQRWRIAQVRYHRGGATTSTLHSEGTYTTKEPRNG